MNKKIYFITGGGTGGHIYPAIAVADELLKENNTQKVYYLGNPNNLEASITKDRDYEFLPVVSSGMPRKISLAFITWSLRLFFAWLKCCFYIKKYNPDVIFATGGYVSAPVLLAGITMRIPFVMHDCDAAPGLVTRILAPYAKSVSIAFDAARDKLNNPDCRLNGNPIRNEFAYLTKKEARKQLGLEDKLTICIMGGSQGAKTINRAACGILKILLQNHELQIIFQTGRKNYDRVTECLREFYPEYEQNKNLIVRPYFNNMVTVLKACDIAVSRAGSLSISEICASPSAAIFIPYPYAASDHQRKNAKYMAEKKAGIYMEDSDTNPETLLNAINDLTYNPKKLQKIEQNALKLAKFDGVKNIINQLREIN